MFFKKPLLFGGVLLLTAKLILIATVSIAVLVTMSVRAAAPALPHLVFLFLRCPAQSLTLNLCLMKESGGCETR